MQQGRLPVVALMPTARTGPTTYSGIGEEGPSITALPLGVRSRRPGSTLVNQLSAAASGGARRP